MVSNSLSDTGARGKPAKLVYQSLTMQTQERSITINANHRMDKRVLD